ncbi:hypothetical protein PR048_026110 [Dryococelus australis]|uniref:C2H2-type domain-containing protein n=1 Tax=Dryococelus australis TaxID=614101 RepID=A0ABQ9GKH2_9NEOP|nr:hypothetical protein PR048_026110 [Dryococelus australis]
MVRLLISYLCEPGSIPGGVALEFFCTWESCRTIPLVGGLSRGSPVFPRPFIPVPLISLHPHRLSRPRLPQQSDSTFCLPQSFIFYGPWPEGGFIFWSPRRLIPAKESRLLDMNKSSSSVRRMEAGADNIGLTRKFDSVTEALGFYVPQLNRMAKDDGAARLQQAVDYLLPAEGIVSVSFTSKCYSASAMSSDTPELMVAMTVPSTSSDGLSTVTPLPSVMGMVSMLQSTSSNGPPIEVLKSMTSSGFRCCYCDSSFSKTCNARQHERTVCTKSPFRAMNHYDDDHMQIMQGDTMNEHSEICKDSSTGSQQVISPIPPYIEAGSEDSIDEDSTHVTNEVASRNDVYNEYIFSKDPNELVDRLRYCLLLKHREYSTIKEMTKEHIPFGQLFMRSGSFVEAVGNYKLLLFSAGPTHVQCVAFPRSTKYSTVSRYAILGARYSCAVSVMVRTENSEDQLAVNSEVFPGQRNARPTVSFPPRLARAVLGEGVEVELLFTGPGNIHHDSRNYSRYDKCLTSEQMGARRCDVFELHHRGSKLDPRSDLRSIQKTVAPLEFRSGLEIDMKFISNRRNWRLEISIRDQQPSSTNFRPKQEYNNGSNVATLVPVSTKEVQLIITVRGNSSILSGRLSVFVKENSGREY